MVTPLLMRTLSFFLFLLFCWGSTILLFQRASFIHSFSLQFTFSYDSNFYFSPVQIKFIYLVGHCFTFSIFSFFFLCLNVLFKKRLQFFFLCNHFYCRTSQKKYLRLTHSCEKASYEKSLISVFQVFFPSINKNFIFAK